MSNVRNVCAWLALISLLMTGCVEDRIGVRSDVQVDQFILGTTKLEDVVKAIGLPQRISKLPGGGQHYFYERTARITGLCVGCGLSSNTLGSVAQATISEGDQKAAKGAVEFAFDPSGVLVSAR